MPGSTSVAVNATTGTAALLLLLTPLGLSPWLLLAGGLSFWGGCGARTALVIIKKLNSTDAFGPEFFARQLAVLFLCIPLAVVASCIVFLAAVVSKADATADAAALCGFLLIMGLRGPDGFQWIVDTCTNILSKFAPAQKPDGGGR